MRGLRVVGAALGLLVVVVALGACGAPPNSATSVGSLPRSDGNGNWDASQTLEQDPTVFRVTGVVQAAPASIVQQNGVNGSFYRGSGYIAGGGTEGKGFVRLLVTGVIAKRQPPISATEVITATLTPPAPVEVAQELVAPGDLVILKTEDTKASALVDGDAVTFICRVQREVVSPVLTNETGVAEKGLIVQELDYCRLDGPVVQPSDAP